jgi:hypothetical protein
MEHHDEGDAHEARLYIKDDALNRTGTGPRPGLLVEAKLPAAQRISGYTAFDCNRLQLHLPLNGRRDPVRHEADESVGKTEPTDASCAGMTKEAFRTLGRVPNLNALCQVDFDRGNLMTPAPSLVQARVVLSGGALYGTKSYKALRNAFFEFFDDKPHDGSGTLAIQPAVEDVEFVFDGDATGAITLGFSDLDDVDSHPPQEFVLSVAGNEPCILLQSFPPASGPFRDPSATLDHFSMYYPLMVHSRERLEPMVRTLARCTEEGSIVHTMPLITDTTKARFATTARRTTSCTTSCLAAQAFAPLLTTQR